MAQINVIPNGQTMEMAYPTNPSEVIAYGFAVAGAAGTSEGNQVQRWLMLVTDLEAKSFPNNTVRIRPAIDAAWRDLDFAGFMAKVRATFVRGTHLYVVANCAYAAQGEEVPLPLPDPAFVPRDPGGQQQGFWGTAPIVVIGGAEDAGIVFVERLNSRATKEHWVLFDSYRQPTASAPIEVRDMMKWSEGSKFAKIIDGTKYTATSTYIVAKCAEFADGVPE